ncbi:MAG: hypothetical protein AAGE01_25635 [Pseudomonadota bacterium]
MSDRYVLAAPPWLQYGVLSAALLASASGVAWVAACFLADAMSTARTLLGGLSLLVLALVANPRVWRRWIHGIADARGLWLPTRGGRMIAIPWRQVGRIQPARATRTVPPGGVVAYVDVDDVLWEQLSWRRDVLEDPDQPVGFRPVPLGVMGHDVAAVIAAIERRRPRS